VFFVRIQFFLLVFLINAAIAAEPPEAPSFPDKQITGVGVSTKSGRTCRGSITTNLRAPSRTNLGKSQVSNANNQLQSQPTKNYDAQFWTA